MSASVPQTAAVERVILICPDRRAGLEQVAAAAWGGALALAVYLGKPLLDHALHGLAEQGVKQALLLVSGAPDVIRRFTENGHRWGIVLSVATESAELSQVEAEAKHPAFQAQAVLTLDSLPQAPGVPVLAGPEAWHQSRAVLLPLLVPGMIGTRELSPGVWTGLRAQVDPTAVLTAPCWIGPAVKISRSARICGFIEEGSMVDHDATVEDSTLAPGTCLGAMTLLRTSLAVGSHLVNWRTGSATHLTDAFLLAPLTISAPAQAPPPARLAALAALILTWPVLLVALVRGKTSGPLFQEKLAVPSRRLGSGPPGEPVRYRELNAFAGPWRRWPMLWRIVTGDFAWTGNPPLTPAEEAELDGEFELRWLSAPTGLFTAPETEGSQPPWDDTAKAHAALFAGRADAAWRRRILLHGLKSLLRPSGPGGAADGVRAAL